MPMPISFLMLSPSLKVLSSGPVRYFHYLHPDPYPPTSHLRRTALRRLHAKGGRNRHRRPWLSLRACGPNRAAATATFVALPPTDLAKAFTPASGTPICSDTGPRGSGHSYDLQVS